MIKLVGHGYGFYLIMCDSGPDLITLAHKTGVKIATSCKCGQCGNGASGFVKGVESLAVVSSCLSHQDYIDRRGKDFFDLYLVRELGHFSGAERYANLAAIVTPSFTRRQSPPAYKVGLHTNLNYKPLPPLAKNIIILAEQTWSSKPIVLF